MILETAVHLSFMQINSKDTYILHYDGTLAFTLVLATFILFNEDAKMFCLAKFRSWKEEQVFRLRYLKNAKASVTPSGATIEHEQPKTIAVIPLNGSVFIVLYTLDIPVIFVLYLFCVKCVSYLLYM